jgi:capsular polysaccharide biosynthesis protein
MLSTVDSRGMRFSQQLYGRLLALYPRAHREEYGPAMAQLFGDQSRDAWRDARGWGLARLWLRILPDLVKTSVLEHLATLNERESMIEKMAAILRPHSAPSTVFLRVFVIVFLLVVTTSTVVTFILPESYASTARIKIERDISDNRDLQDSPMMPGYDPYFIQTEFEVIQSQVVLDKVIEALDLNSVWGKKYAGGAKLKESESLGLLKARLDLRPVRNTSLIEIRVYAEEPNEPARIANAIAETYQKHRRDQQRQLTLVTRNTAEQRVKMQERKVMALQANVDHLRKELNVPNPEPAADELRTKYQPYWAAKRETDVASRFLDQLSMKNESEWLDANMPRHALVEIVDRATPGLRPVHPNKPLNIVLGVLTGMFLAAVAGAAMAGIAALRGRRPRGGGVEPGPGASSPPNASHFTEGRHVKSVADTITGILWMGVGVILSCLVAAAMFFQGFGAATPEGLIIPLVGMFWGGVAVAGFFLFRGKFWARICIGVAGALIAAYFYLTLGFPFPMRFRPAFIVFGLTTVCALVLPRKQTTVCTS